jgi:hypothetical protein
MLKVKQIRLIVYEVGVNFDQKYDFLRSLQGSIVLQLADAYDLPSYRELKVFNVRSDTGLSGNYQPPLINLYGALEPNFVWCVCITYWRWIFGTQSRLVGPAAAAMVQVAHSSLFFH